MPILFFIFFSLLTAFTPSAAAEGQTIRLKNGASGWLVLPEESAEGPKKSGEIKHYPALILIHEWWGLNDSIKGLAEEFAANGYAAFAVDLYRGQAADEPMKAHELMRGLPDDRALQDLETAAAYLRVHPQVDGAKIGVIGWCMGGGFALKLAIAESQIKAAVVYYGKLVTDKEQLAKLNAPLLGIFGADDGGISADSVNEFEFRLLQLGKRADIRIYPHAGHAFANPENKDGYRPEAAEDAWRRTLAFFRANL